MITDKINKLELGSSKRLKLIASSNLGQRSIAAEKALNNRARRKELCQDYDCDFETACIIVNTEINKK